MRPLDATYAFIEGPYQAEYVTSVQGFDLDAGDTVTYRIVGTGDDPEMLGAGPHPFAVDPVTGVLTIEDALDFETQVDWWIGVEVEDAGGLTALGRAHVHVSDTDQFVSRFELSFGSFSPFYTADDPCGLFPLEVSHQMVGDAEPHVHSNPFRNFANFVTISEGVVDFFLTVGFEPGRIDAHVDGEVVIELPDEITAGETVSVGHVWIPERSSLTGLRPGASVHGHLGIHDGRLRIYDCDSQYIYDDPPDYEGDCDSVMDGRFDPEEPDGTEMRYEFGSTARSFEFAVESDPATPWFVDTGPQRDRFFQYNYAFISYVQWAMELAGLPHPGRFFVVYAIGDLIMKVEGWAARYGAHLEVMARSQASMEAGALDATFVFEDGTQQEVVIPACYQLAQAAQDDCLEGTYPSFDLDVPAGADEDGDGRVDITVRFQPRGTIHRVADIPMRLTGYLSMGYVNIDYLKPLPDGDTERVGSRALGPIRYSAITTEDTKDCAPTVPLTPFNTITRRGALDLAR